MAGCSIVKILRLSLWYKEVKNWLNYQDFAAAVFVKMYKICMYGGFWPVIYIILYVHIHILTCMYVHMYICSYIHSYDVIFILETCNDCIGIKINGSRQSSNENFCAPIGSNVIIQADVPLISSQHSVYLRFNGNEMNCLSNCEKSSNLTYHCNNLTAINYGNYCIHVRFTYDPEERIPEWQSDNITIVVQCA